MQQAKGLHGGGGGGRGACPARDTASPDCTNRNGKPCISGLTGLFSSQVLSKRSSSLTALAAQFQLAGGTPLTPTLGEVSLEAPDTSDTAAASFHRGAEA